MSYAEFLRRKLAAQQAPGIYWQVPGARALFPFQQQITEMALARGRAAVFAACGLGKSRMALSWAHAVTETQGKPVLILTPLSVAPQFLGEASEIGLGDATRRIREPRDITDEPLIWVCNYDRLHMLGDLVPRLAGVVLDESSILKSFDGKTCRALIDAFRATPYRLACTATPSPNDHIELGTHAEFLGVCTRAEMLAQYFIHDGGDTSKWRLKGHAVRPFWRWVSSWAIACSHPRDLGHDDAGYDLPPLELHDHVIDVDQRLASQHGMLFSYEATTLSEQRAVRRDTLAARVALIAQLVNESTEQWLVWCELNAEADALEHAIDGAVQVSGSDSADAKESAVSAFTHGRARVIVTKPTIFGFGLNLQCCSHQVFAGSGHSYEQWHQAVRRSWRFGQRRTVHVHMVRSSADAAIAANMHRKMQAHDDLIAHMQQGANR